MSPLSLLIEEQAYIKNGMMTEWDLSARPSREKGNIFQPSQYNTPKEKTPK
jgi:hypothetical protein